MKKSSQAKTPKGGQVRELERLLTEISTKVDGLTKSVDDLTKQVTHLTREMDRVTRMEEKQTADRSDLKRIQKDVDALAEKQRACETERAELSARIGKLEAAQDGDKKQLSVLWKVMLYIGAAAVGGGGVFAALGEVMGK